MGKCIAITGAGAGLGRAGGHIINISSENSRIASRHVFAQENLKRGLNLRDRPISSFKSVAEFIRLLSHLPGDLNVREIRLEARRP